MPKIIIISEEWAEAAAVCIENEAYNREGFLGRLGAEEAKSLERKTAELRRLAAAIREAPEKHTITIVVPSEGDLDICDIDVENLPMGFDYDIRNFDA